MPDLLKARSNVNRLSINRFLLFALVYQLLPHRLRSTCAVGHGINYHIAEITLTWDWPPRCEDVI